MPKPQSGADIKLINAGITLAKQKGLSGFSVRELCSAAKVNSGLFHYYFTSRENFNKAVLVELYNSLIKELDINVPSNIPPKEKLIAFVNALSGFTKNNSSLLASIAIDIFSGNREILLFIRNNFTRHISMALSIIEECKKARLLEDADSIDILISFVLPVIVPNVAVSVLFRAFDKKEANKLKPLKEKILSEKSIKERIKLSLKAVLQ